MARRRSYKNHFEYTLNKLHVWNMLEYERVIYMDADNIFFHNIDKLFKCGHFCAVYMNPCNFHTGLFVVTPNNATYNDLLKSLAELVTLLLLPHSQPSYDGADQGFLVAYFEGLQSAPLFDPDHPIPESSMPKMQRLSIGYNNNHMYVSSFPPTQLPLSRRYFRPIPRFRPERLQRALLQPHLRHRSHSEGR